MSQQIEIAVLGACLQEDPDALKEVLRRVRPEHFELDSHQRIYRTLGKLSEVNTLLLLEVLGPDVAQCGGTGYIADLTSGLPRRLGATIHVYIDRLLEAWRIREIRRISAGMENPDNSADAIRQAIDSLESLRGQTAEDTAVEFLADFPSFVTDASASVDWMLASVIERGANGFIGADPKTGKSFCAADLALAMATGSRWIDFAVPRPVKVALVSREDTPALTAWRLRNLTEGRDFTPVQLGYLERNLYINTRAQTTNFMLDDYEQVSSLIDAVRLRGIEFILLDVMNILHRSDENDNTQMAEVLRKAKRIQDQTGASLGIIHHFKKDEPGRRITQRLRGASAIAGFAEWIIGLSLADEEAGIRKVEFELKAGAPPEPVHFCIENGNSLVRIKRVAMQASSKQQRKGVN